LKTEMSALTGIPKTDVCSEQFVNSIDDPELKLAFEYRKLFREFTALNSDNTKMISIMRDEVRGMQESLFLGRESSSK